MNHCKIENYTCPNVPDGEICVCIGCGDLYFHDTDGGCYCDNPCQKFDDMQQKAYDGRVCIPASGEKMSRKEEEGGYQVLQ